MESKIAHNNILLILTQKLRLLNTLNEKARQNITKFLVNNQS